MGLRHLLSPSLVHERTGDNTMPSYLRDIVVVLDFMAQPHQPHPQMGFWRSSHTECLGYICTTARTRTLNTWSKTGSESILMQTPSSSSTNLNGHFNRPPKSNNKRLQPPLSGPGSQWIAAGGDQFPARKQRSKCTPITTRPASRWVLHPCRYLEPSSGPSSHESSAPGGLDGTCRPTGGVP